jgi:hypothetical protein
MKRKVYVPEGMKQAGLIVNDAIVSITLFLNIFLDGFSGPNFLIFPRGYRITETIITLFSRNFKIRFLFYIFFKYLLFLNNNRQTHSGFINEDVLYSWAVEDFIPFCAFQRRNNESKPILALCDGHSSRFSPRIWKKLLENNIFLYCIPSHSSHLFQILDLMPNAAIKKNLQLVKPIKKGANEKQIIEFVNDIEVVISKSLTKDIIAAGFLNIFCCFYCFCIIIQVFMFFFFLFKIRMQKISFV